MQSRSTSLEKHWIYQSQRGVPEIDRQPFPYPQTAQSCMAEKNSCLSR
ncbi:hypothetical protein C4K03_4678 [Pseudomonas synxantha]|uniref:Uncharacterized protein n=1 Tax=Pseudomonas synxantha TaxID=47883 RepID=A0A3G7UE45_9PSED|nr:hypothetical protein C4K03_4678 [Pseudomonas synxantha]